MPARNYTMGKLRTVLTLLILIVLAAVSDKCEAAAPITISQLGPGSYSISTVDLPEAAGMDMTVKYDAQYLESPQVKTGSLVPAGALMVPNTATAGSIRIAIVTGGAIKGTGELVSISFTVKKKPAPLPTLSSSVYSAAGTQLAVDSSLPASLSQSTDSNTDSSKSSTADTQRTSSSSVAQNLTATSSASSQVSTQITASGSLLPSQESGAARDDSRRETVREDSGTSYVAASTPVETKNGSATSNSALAASGTAPTAATGKGAPSTLKSIQSVLDRFRTYSDVRSLRLLSALFDVKALQSAGIVQTPAIVVSDGKSRITITIDLGKEADAPSFSLKGANQKSLRRTADNKWELEALPQKGKSDVRLSILLKGERIEIPLVAIPPLNPPFAREFDAMKEAGLESLLAKPLKSGKPAYDLNSDSKQDYIDDYLLVGHWLLKKQRSSGGAVRKPAAIHK